MHVALLTSYGRTLWCISCMPTSLVLTSLHCVPRSLILAQSQLPKVAMLHTRCNQWHGDVPVITKSLDSNLTHNRPLEMWLTFEHGRLWSMEEQEPISLPRDQ